MSNDVQHHEQWSRMSFDMDYLLGALPTDPMILRFIDDVRWLRAQLVESEATLATIGGADKATLARKLRRANAATRDAEQERAAVIDAFNAMQIANKQTHELWLTRTALLVETLRSLARVSMSDQEYITCPSCGAFLWRHGPDCPVRAIMELPAFSPRAALTAPATQPDERAATERAEVVAAAKRYRRGFVGLGSSNADMGENERAFFAAVDALDATDGAAKEGA